MKKKNQKIEIGRLYGKDVVVLVKPSTKKIVIEGNLIFSRYGAALIKKLMAKNKVFHIDSLVQTDKLKIHKYKK